MSRIAWIVAAVVVIAAIGWIDYITGPRWGFSLFYLSPVLIVGWWRGRVAAVVVAFAASVAWFHADLAWQPDAIPSIWNAVTRFVMYAAIGYQAAAIRHDRERLRRLLEEERRVSRTDVLTGLLNRRAFYERVESELARSRRTGAPIALLYVDVDNFKRVNDRYGHARGDELLAELATALQTTLRATDVAARLGGDEFAALVVDVDRDRTGTIAERIIGNVDRLTAPYAETGVGVSIGAVWYAEAPENVEHIVQAADHAMYRAKDAGKHRVVLDEQRG